MKGLYHPSAPASRLPAAAPCATIELGTEGNSTGFQVYEERGAKVMPMRIGNSNDVAAGRISSFDVAGIQIDVANVDGHLYAFDDTCTHAGCSLAKGQLDGTTVTCACHGSQFDVTSGVVLRGPAARPVRSRVVQVDGEDLLTEA